MKKILWLDVETTGLDPEKHALIQIAAIVEQDQKILGEFDVWIRPFPGSKVTRDALKKTQITINELRNDPKFIDPDTAFHRFIEFMNHFVDRFDKTDKFIIAGKNVKFDIGFMRKWFEHCDDNYYGAWFHYPSIDLEHTFAEVMLHEDDFMLKQYTLESMCELFNIKLKAHDAIGDIKATREIYHRLTGE